MLRTRLQWRTPLATEVMSVPTAASGAVPAPRRVYPAPVSPVTRMVRHRQFSLRALSFVIIVLLPVVIVAAYYFLIAADQYVSEFRLTLRTVDTPQVDPLLLFGSDVAHSPAATEAQVVVQYIGSRAIVDDLDPTLDLRSLFAPPQADWWARLWLPASIEQLVFYWRNQVDPFYDSTTGTIVVRVRAFTAPDALRLAQTIVAASEKLVNDLSARARRDAVQHAETDVAQAETRLKSVLAQIREFRDREGMIDPGKTADATTTLANKLRDDLLKANSELATLRAYMRDDAPAVKVLKARIRSLETQQRGLARELTDSGKSSGEALTRPLGSYEQLDAERKFAEAAYQHALEALDRARDNADRQHIYIASFVPPSLPESPLYPRRWRSLGVAALVAFAVWAISTLTVQSVRDHL
jgi:capsular polysaccharide transport system permease protein